MSQIASFFVKFVGRASSRRFEQATQDPVAAQLRKLRQILRRNRDTEYGREYGFGSINSLTEYQEAVPVVTYEDVKERMDRVTRGEKNVMTAEDPVMFAKTSGTAGDAKYIPVTPTCQGRDHSDQMRTWFYHAIKDHPGVFKGKAMSLVSPAVEGHAPSGVPFGSTSGHIYKNMPGVIRGTYAVPYDVFGIEDYETKYYVLMRLGLQMNVTLMATANPSSIIKLCEMANSHADNLLRDLADGTIRPELDIDPHILWEIKKVLRPRKAWAAQLEQARARRNGRLLPVDYWPNLTMIGCWKGGTVGAYLQRFPEWFWPESDDVVIPVRDWGYLSSEARGSIPLSDHGSGGVLTVGTNVYEFVEASELESAPDTPQSWTFLGVDQLDVGQEYYIFFTTTGGLYRYDINDVICVVGKYNETPLITFRRKGRGATSITGEKVTVNQVIEAFERSMKDVGVAVEHFKVEADVENANYLFMAEARSGIDEATRRPLLHALEKNLSRLNIEYEAKRKSLRLGPPRLLIMKAGWYDRQKKALIAEGKRLFQAKTICLSQKQNQANDEVEAVVPWES